MKMSEEMAVRLHRMMWSDMQRELGDNPSGEERAQFKFDWIHKRFPSESIANDCWLCEYAVSVVKPGDSEPCCKYCPISWPNCLCNTLDFSYAKEPISEILALPAKDESIAKKAVSVSDLSRDIDLNEVRKRLKDAIGTLKLYQSALSHESDFPASAPIADHIKAIQIKAKEKAVEEYFDKTPGAKLATMDVDDAFKQYADEQKAPIFKQLSNASGLSENNHDVLDHIILIKNKAKQEGRDETKQQMKDLLAEQSGLNHNIPIDDHIREIVKNSMEAGAAEERDRIQEKIYEVLLS